MRFAFNRLLFASTNKGKLKEVIETVASGSLEVLGLGEIQRLFNLSGPPEVDESALTYEGNSRLKAEAIFEWSKGVPTLADDSGLEVEALGGQPGVNTSRYAGLNASNDDNIEKLLKELAASSNRKAKFVCCLYLILQKGKIYTARAEFKGSIAESPFGDGGFGYDPVFIPEGFNESLAELKGRGVEVPTHRIKALGKLFSELQVQL